MSSNPYSRLPPANGEDGIELGVAVGPSPSYYYQPQDVVVLHQQPAPIPVADQPQVVLPAVLVAPAPAPAPVPIPAPIPAPVDFADRLRQRNSDRGFSCNRYWGKGWRLYTKNCCVLSCGTFLLGLLGLLFVVLGLGIFFGMVYRIPGQDDSRFILGKPTDAHCPFVWVDWEYEYEQAPSLSADVCFSDAASSIFRLERDDDDDDNGYGDDDDDDPVPVNDCPALSKSCECFINKRMRTVRWGEQRAQQQKGKERVVCLNPNFGSDRGPCEVNEDCVYGQFCGLDLDHRHHQYQDHQRQKTCKPFSKRGDVCDQNNLCLPGLTCNNQEGRGICVEVSRQTNTTNDQAGSSTAAVDSAFQHQAAYTACREAGFVLRHPNPEAAPPLPVHSPCQTDQECGSDQFCDSHKCMPYSWAAQACDFNRRCAPGLTCDSGVCKGLADPPPGGSTSVDEKCIEYFEKFGQIPPATGGAPTPPPPVSSDTNARDDYDYNGVGGLRQSWPVGVGMLLLLAIVATLTFIPLKAAFLFSVMDAMTAPVQPGKVSWWWKALPSCPYSGRLYCLVLATGLVTGLASIAGSGASSYLSLAFMFAVPLHKQHSFLGVRGSQWVSAVVVFRYYAQLVLLVLGLFLVNFLGLLCLGMGLLVSLPFSVCVLVECYNDLIGINGAAASPPVPRDESCVCWAKAFRSFALALVFAEALGRFGMLFGGFLAIPGVLLGLFLGAFIGWHERAPRFRRQQQQPPSQPATPAPVRQAVPVAYAVIPPPGQEVSVARLVVADAVV